MTCAEDAIEELPTPVRLKQLEHPEAEQRNLLVAASLTGSEAENLRAAQLRRSTAD